MNVDKAIREVIQSFSILYLNYLPVWYMSIQECYSHYLIRYAIDIR
jgi:hypothetical protein